MRVGIGKVLGVNVCLEDDYISTKDTFKQILLMV